MADGFDVPRIDRLPGRESEGAVAGPQDRQPRRRRQSPHAPPREPGTAEEDEDRQIGSKLDVRA